MLPPRTQLPADQRRLLRLYRDLSDGERDSLLSFAEFLVQRRSELKPAVKAPLPIEPGIMPRPESESVVAAIRRLTCTFPMLDKGELLHEASELMTAHVLQGRPAVEVIDELEAIFRRRYERAQLEEDFEREAPR